jgi:hypothetical protein
MLRRHREASMRKSALNEVMRDSRTGQLVLRPQEAGNYDPQTHRISHCRDPGDFQKRGTEIDEPIPTRTHDMPDYPEKDRLDLANSPPRLSTIVNSP